MDLLKELVKRRILDKEKASSIENEVKTTGKKAEEIILGHKIVPEDYLFILKSEKLKIPLKKVYPDDVPLKVLEFIPEESAKYYQMIPIEKQGNVLKVGMVYPEDFKGQEALEFLARQAKFNYKVCLISLSDFNNILKKYRTLRKEVTTALEELETEFKAKKKATEKRVSWSDFESMAEEAPVSRVVAVLLKHAVEGNASDIHIEPLKDKVRVRFRLDGVLYSSIFLPQKIHSSAVARIKILSSLKIDETRIPQDGRFSTKINDRHIDFRVSTIPTTMGEKVAIRILDPVKRKVELKELGLRGRNFEAIKTALNKAYGMILTTGPTGCGKTTTLYALLEILNQDKVNIITLEDPVEYFLEGVNQSQIKPEIGYTFASGLRHILRQDPDVVMVGEIRDEETASLATHASLTGHIVLSTLHTNNAVGVISRLVDMRVRPFLIAPTLSIVIAQRLIRKLCLKCRKKVRPSRKAEIFILNEIKKLPVAIKQEINIPRPLVVYNAQGCKDCSNKGYTGRIGIFEILEITDELAETIAKGGTEGQVFQEAFKHGMTTMKQDGIIKALEGITTLEEVLRAAEEK